MKRNIPKCQPPIGENVEDMSRNVQEYKDDESKEAFTSQKIVNVDFGSDCPTRSRLLLMHWCHKLRLQMNATQ